MTGPALVGEHRWRTEVPDWTGLRGAAVRLKHQGWYASGETMHVEVLLGMGDERVDVLVRNDAHDLPRTPPADDRWRTDERTRLRMVRKHAGLDLRWEVSAAPGTDGWQWHACMHAGMAHFEQHVREAVPDADQPHPLLRAAAAVLHDRAALLHDARHKEVEEELHRHADAIERRTPPPHSATDLCRIDRLTHATNDAQRVVHGAWAIAAALETVPDLPAVPDTADLTGLLESLDHALAHTHRNTGPHTADAPADERAYDRATEHLEGIIERSPDDEPARNALAAVHLARARHLLEGTPGDGS